MAKKKTNSDINIYIFGSKGITIGDRNNVSQSYNNIIDLSTWSSVEKLALAYLSGFSNQTPYINNEVEIISLDAAEYIDEKYGILRTAIQKSREEINKYKNSKIGALFSENEIKDILSPVLQAINNLIKENLSLRIAFEDLQSRLENRGSPNYLVVSEIPKSIQVDTEDLLQLAHLYFSEDKLVQATDVLHEYLKTYPQSLDASNLLMEILILTRKYNDAVIWCEKTPTAKNSPDAVFFLTVAFIKLEKHNDAKREIASFSEKFPTDPRLNILKATYHQEGH